MKRAAVFNTWLATKITQGVGTMWCAYVFGLIALISLPSAIAGGVATTIQWVAQTFLQLVLLSIILVGQDIQGQASAAMQLETHDAVMEEIGYVRQDHTAMAVKVGELHQFHIEGQLPDRITKP